MDRVSDDSKCVIFNYLELDEGLALSLVSKYFFSLFNSLIEKNKLSSTQQLLSHVARGEESEIKTFIQKNPRTFLTLLSVKADVLDYSGREFKNITLFQCAVWAQDIDMCFLLLFETKRIDCWKLFYAQYQALVKNGITYIQGDVTHSMSTRFNFREIFSVLEEIIESDLAWSSEEQTEYVRRFGRAEQNLPANIAQEFCWPERGQNPNLDEPFNNRFLQYTHYRYPPGSKTFSWWTNPAPSEKLGETFCIKRALGISTNGVITASPPHSLSPQAVKNILKDDLTFFKKLNEQREQIFNQLEDIMVPR